MHPAPRRRPSRSGAGGRLSVAVQLALLVGCATANTTVDGVWRDSARTGALGKTLVFVLLPESHVAIPLENEWQHDQSPRPPALAGLMACAGIL